MQQIGLQFVEVDVGKVQRNHTVGFVVHNLGADRSQLLRKVGVFVLSDQLGIIVHDVFEVNELATEQILILCSRNKLRNKCFSKCKVVTDTRTLTSESSSSESSESSESRAPSRSNATGASTSSVLSSWFDFLTASAAARCFGGSELAALAPRCEAAPCATFFADSDCLTTGSVLPLFPLPLPPLADLRAPPERRDSTIGLGYSTRRNLTRRDNRDGHTARDSLSFEWGGTSLNQFQLGSGKSTHRRPLYFHAPAFRVLVLGCLP